MAGVLFRGTTGRVLAVLLVVACIWWGALGAWIYGARADPDPARVQVGERDIVLVELAGSKSAARALVCRGVDITTPETSELGPGLRPRAPRGSCTRPVQIYKHAVRADLWLIGGYAVGLGGLCLLGAALFHVRRSRRIAGAASVATLIAAGLDVVEDLLLDEGLDGLLTGDGAWAWRWAAAAAVTKFALLLPVAIVAATAAAVVTVRAVVKPPDYTWAGWPDVLPPPRVVGEHGDEWPPDGGPPLTPAAHLARPQAQVGICVSGGGIRSASVALGALQELRSAGIFGRARYLVSVSGGGYITGALRLALQPDPAGVATVMDPATVFAPNTPEVDHVRRHGRYVADTLGEWVVALGTLLRGVVVSLGLLAGLVTLVGAVLGRFYFYVPLLRGEELPLPGTRGAETPSFPHLSTGAGWAFGVLFLLALVLWFFSVIWLNRRRLSQSLRVLSRAVFGLTAVVAVLGIAIPVAVWGYFRLLWWLADLGDISVASAVSGGGAGTVVLAYLGTLVSILWRKRERIGGVRRLLPSAKAASVQRQVPTGIVQRLIVWFVLLVLALIYGALLAAVIWVGLKASTFDLLRSPGDALQFDFWPRWFVVVVPVVFLLVAVFVDQTWMSLHPFYRQRLATAFAVRRRAGRPGLAETAVPYPFSEPTPLSTYAAPVPAPGMPQVIFAAAANLSGSDRTPPGRRATSFTLSFDWVGGPQVGYVRTGVLERRVSSSIAKDLTVQSAVAVSGAAFASAMGRQARAFQTLLALSNARLGTWLPNPAWLSACRPVADWRQPRLPGVRRATYLLREVVASYDPQDRLLLVTDGGHYENLGLVELLRHRCRTVYCIDASGDAPPLAGTLGDAIALAAEELGVRITLDNPLDLVPGSAEPLKPDNPLATLNARLSAGVVVTGTITYPEAFQAQGETQSSATGRLVVAKTRLTADMPAELLSYAQSNPVFPHDSTDDQWFDQGQFNAYHRLGMCLGQAAAAAVVPTPEARR